MMNRHVLTGAGTGSTDVIMFSGLIDHHFSNIARNGNHASIQAYQVFWRGVEQSGFCLPVLRSKAPGQNLSKKNNSEAVKRELKIRFQEN